jgi:hypothetical protein
VGVGEPVRWTLDAAFHARNAAAFYFLAVEDGVTPWPRFKEVQRGVTKHWRELISAGEDVPRKRDCGVRWSVENAAGVAEAVGGSVALEENEELAILRIILGGGGRYFVDTSPELST